MDRRTIVTRFVQAIGVLAVGGLATPALITGLSPLLKRRDDLEDWRPVGVATGFPIGDIVRTTVDPPIDTPLLRLGKAVFVWRRAEDDFVVYSPSCTDLGCPVTWDGGSRWFYCPCHGGIFSKDGEPQAGPPKLPLYRYAVRLRDGQLEIDLASLPPHI